MTYNVFGGTLSLTRSVNQSIIIHRCDTVVRLHSSDSSVIVLEQVEEEESRMLLPCRHVCSRAGKTCFLKKKFLGF